jgi:predicted nucleic acid-binding protein
MTSVCFDTSALVALFVGDEFGERAERYIGEQNPTILVSDFAAVEFASAVSRLVRMRLLSRSAAAGVFTDFDAWRRGSTTGIAIGAEDLASAEAFLRRLEFNLRAGDAIHIGVAQRAQAALATFDQRMAEVAAMLGVEVAPA